MAKVRRLKPTTGVKLKDRFAVGPPGGMRAARKVASKQVVAKVGAKLATDGAVVEVLELGSGTRAFTKRLKPAPKPRKTQSQINAEANARDGKRKAKSVERAKKAWIPVVGNFNG